MLLTLGVLSSCNERECTNPGVCWANREDMVAAAKRCGIKDFEPKKIANTLVPYVEGESPDAGRKTQCIIDDLKGQGLMVTR